MAVYGQYETVTELGRSGSVATYKARPADGGWELGFDELGSDANFALKVFQPRSAEDAGAAERRRFLERVRSQKRVYEAGGRHWAPVLQAGEARGQAFYVTDFFPRTAAAVARDGEAVDAQNLYALIEGVLLGLMELKRTQGRPHGNLKPGNVLIRGVRGDIVPDDVALTDPALEQDAMIAGEAEDLYCLGELIHVLVIGRRFPGQQTWPVQPSGRWDELGKQGEAWRGLCNHLLSPRASENWIRIEDVLDEVQALRPRGGIRRRDAAGRKTRSRRRRKLLAAALVLLLLIGGAGTVQYFRYQRQWRDLCTDYATWFGPIAASLENQPPKAISEDAYLNEHLVQPLAKAKASHTPLDPREIAGSDLPAISLADRPPMSFSAMWKSQKASRVVNRIEHALGPGQWKALEDVKQRSAQYRARGWEKLAAYAQSLSESIPLSGGAMTSSTTEGGQWVAAVEKFLAGQALLTRLETARAAAQGIVSSLAKLAETSPIREKIEPFRNHLRVPAESDAILPTPQALDALAKSLEDANQLVGRFEKIVPTLEDAARRARAYDFRGWSGASRFLAALTERATPSENLDKLTADVAAAKARWDQIDARWKQIGTRRELLEKSGDRILATYRSYVTSQKLGEHQELDSLLKALERINDEPAWAAAAKRVAEPDWTKFDVVAFAGRSEAHRRFVGRPFATSEDLNKWLAETGAMTGSRLAAATISPQPSTSGNPADRAVAKAAPPVPPPTPPTTLQTATPVASAGSGAPPLVIQPPKGGSPSVKVVGPDPIGPATRPSEAAVAHSFRQIPPLPIPRTGTSSGIGPFAPANNPPATKPAQPALPDVQVADATLRRPGPGNVKPADVNVIPRDIALEAMIHPDIAAFIADSRGGALNVANPHIKDAWARRGAEIAATVQKDMTQFQPLKAQREKLRTRLVRLDDALKAASQPPDLSKAAGNSPWNAPLIQKIRTIPSPSDVQLSQLIELARTGEERFDRELEGLRGANTQWREAALRLVVDANKLEGLLAAGHVLSDDAVTSTLSGIRSNAVYKSPGVPETLDPLLKPIATVQAARESVQLRQVATSPSQPLGLRLTAWSLVGGTKEPPSLDALEQDLKLGHELLASAQGVMSQDKARLDAIKSALESHLRLRWEAVLENASRPEDVQMAMAMQSRISGVDASRLAPRARFNFALRDLRDALVSAGEGEEAQRALEAPVARLSEIARELPPQDQASAKVAGLLAEAGRLDTPSAVDFDKLGPRAVSGRGGALDWSVSVLEGGQVAAYRAMLKSDARNSQELTLVFRRVKPSAASRASWVMTSEMSLGTFDSLLGAAGKWQELRAGRLLPEYNPARGDPRPGPRVWQWPRLGRRENGITHSIIWLSTEVAPRGSDHYPSAIGAFYNRTAISDPTDQYRPSDELNPSKDQPMQYVSARAAALAASAAGCRLPTPDEWRAARASADQHMGVNLRDLTWRLQLDHMKRTGGGNPRWRPDAGMFTPQGEQVDDRITVMSGRELDDGILWFRPVPPTKNNVFLDIVGNVAELVAGAGPGIGAGPGGSGGGAAKQDRTGVFVMGGSALSPPNRPHDRPYELEAEQLTSAWSDVGFRLAFSEPAPPVDRLREAVAGNWYLTK